MYNGFPYTFGFRNLKDFQLPVLLLGVKLH